MLAIMIMFFTEVITSTLTGSYRYEDMGYHEIRGKAFNADNRVVVAVIDSGLSAHSYNYLSNRVTLKLDTSRNTLLPLTAIPGETHADMVIRSIVDTDTELPGTCFLSSCHVYLYRAMSSKKATSNSVANSLMFACTDTDVDIVNLSFSSVDSNVLTEWALLLCALQNKLVVASAGNEGYDDRENHVCLSSWVLCIGGVAQVGGRHDISNAGPNVDIYAPSTPYNLQNGTLGDGTSGAAALVSGIAALILSQNKHLTGRQLHRILIDSAQLNSAGILVVNVAEGLKLAATYKPVSFNYIIALDN